MAEQSFPLAKGIDDKAWTRNSGQRDGGLVRAQGGRRVYALAVTARWNRKDAGSYVAQQ